MVFSLTDTKPPATEEPHVLSSQDMGEDLAPDPLERASQWSELYRGDFEYDTFWQWFDRRNNDHRPDRMSLLSEIPLHFGPSEIPPPLRKHFRETFNQES